MTQAEALRLAFPEGAAVERRTAYLTEDQARRARALARAPVESLVWTYYEGKTAAGTAGYAYFETHVVRSQSETLMAVLDARGRLRFIELLAFHEPADYEPSTRWLAQLKGKSIEDGLWIRRGIRNIAGASLTSQAVTEAARRLLAIHAILHPPPEAPAAAGRETPR